MKLLIENNLLGHNRTMKSPVKNKRGTLYGCLFIQGDGEGKEVYDCRRVIPVSDLAVQRIFSFELIF